MQKVSRGLKNMELNKGIFVKAKKAKFLLPAVAFIIISAGGCTGGQIKLEPSVSVDDYQKYPWDKKITFFESLEKGREEYPSDEVYAGAFSDPVSGVVIAALNSLPDKKIKELKPRLYLLLKYKNPVVKWKACQKISSEPEDTDVPYIASVFSAEDWMVRECAFRSLRKYGSERKRKSYFFNVVSALFDVNPQVLKEVYKTLKWYRDPRAFSFMYKRLFHARNPAELIIIMRELAEYDNRSVYQRLIYLSIHHPDFYVRQEAKNILKSM